MARADREKSLRRFSISQRRGRYDGVALRQWIDDAADRGGFISRIGNYRGIADCAWPLEEGDPVDEPS